MKSIKKYIIAILTILAVQSPLHQTVIAQDCVTVDKVVRDAFADATCYKYGHCGYNVRNLLARLQQNGHDIANFDVVIFTGQFRLSSGVPVRRGKIVPNIRRQTFGDKAWDYHAIVFDKSTKKVLDLDFSANPAPTGEYIEKMFDKPGENVLENIYIKRVGAHQYIELLEKHGVTGIDNLGPVIELLKAETAMWPEVKLKELLDL